MRRLSEQIGKPVEQGLGAFRTTTKSLNAKMCGDIHRHAPSIFMKFKINNNHRLNFIVSLLIKSLIRALIILNCAFGEKNDLNLHFL